MLRTLARTAVILVLAATVAAVLYVAVASGSPSLSGQALVPPGAASFDHHSGREHSRRDGASPGRGEHRHQEGHGVAGMLGTALQVALVGGGVVAVQKAARRRRGGRGR